MKYNVPVTYKITNIYIVEANSKEEAMNLALNYEDSDYITHIEINESDAECYYPDITEIWEKEKK